MTHLEELQNEFKDLQFIFDGHARLVCRALARGMLPSVVKVMSSDELMLEETMLSRAGNDDNDLCSDWESLTANQDPVVIESTHTA